MEQTATDLDKLYEAYAVHLNKYMFTLTRNREEAADLVQEAFLRLCQQISLPEYPRTWLSRTGYRLFIDRWRREQRLLKLPLVQVVPDLATPEQAVLHREFEMNIYRLLRRLKPQARTAFHLRVYEQYSYNEISQLLGCSENTVKSYIRRGRVQLSKWL
jgi:RNA polymerase sigma factor (sigma-70 family)